MRRAPVRSLTALAVAVVVGALVVTAVVAKGFPDRDVDGEDEQVFREALGPRIREYDPAAAKAGHWT